jgi:peptidoglycan/LPS O-acetylase OafA/YrhL
VIGFHEGASGLPGGFLGVDIFFVLSGFLITDLLVARYDRTGRLDLAGFWTRRARRLLPARSLAGSRCAGSASGPTGSTCGTGR